MDNLASAFYQNYKHQAQQILQQRLDAIANYQEVRIETYRMTYVQYCELEEKGEIPQEEDSMPLATDSDSEGKFNGFRF